MEFFKNLLDLLKSPRFIALYWMTLWTSLAGFVDLMLVEMGALDLPDFAVLVVGGLLTQASKAIHNKMKGKPLGFKK